MSSAAPIPPLVERPALVERVSAALDRGGLVVVAGAGYGKTTLLEDALRARPEPVAWAGVQTGDRDAGRLLVTLLQALDVAVPGVAGAQLEQPGAASDPVAAARRLPAELDAVLVEPVVLVIDDAEHLVGAPEALAVVESLLRARSARLRVVVATRRPLELSLAKARVAGQLAELHQDDLAFSADECAQVLALGLGREPSAAEVAARMDETLGWPLGVVLGAQGGESPELALGAFLDEEVLAPLDPGARAAVLASSAVEELTPPVLEALGLGSGFVARASSYGLVLVPGGRRGAVAYHPLVRELLRARWREETAPADRAALMARAGRPLADEGRTQEAIGAWLEGECWGEALAAMTASAPMLLGASPATVRAWLARLPAEARAAPPARLLAAQLVLGEGRPAHAADELRDALPELREADLRTQWTARLVLAECLYFGGRLDDVSELAAGFDRPEVRALGGLGDAVALWAAMAHAAAGRLMGAERLARMLEQAGGEDVGVLRTWREAFVHGPSGEVDGILARIAQELDVADRDPHLWRPDLLLPTSIWLLSARGRFDEALQLNDEHMRRIDELAVRADMAALSHVLHAWLLAHSDRPAEALAALEAASAAPPAAWPAAVVEGARALIAHHAGRPADAAAAARRAADHLDQAPTLLADIIGFSLIPLIAEVDPAAARAMVGERLDRLALTHPDRWGRFHRARLLAQLAWIRHREGERERARADVVASLEAADDMAPHLLRAEWPRMGEVALAALDGGVVPGLLEALEVALPGELLPLTEHPVSAVRIRAAEALGRSGHGETATRLSALGLDPDPEVAAAARIVLERTRLHPPVRSFTLLGGFGLRRGEWPVEDRAWERPMAQRLVRLLLVRRDEVVLEDDLFEAFWPGKSPGAARSSLQVAVSRARAVLDPPGAEDSTIQSVRGGYQLVLHPRDRVDADEFERAAAAALAATGPARLPALDAAERLWTGEPLPEDRYADWSQPWRERLESLRREVLAALLDACLATSALTRGMGAAHRALELDPLDERAHRGLMLAYARAGRRGRALRQYLECRRALVEGVGIEPSEETALLQRRILAGAGV